MSLQFFIARDRFQRDLPNLFKTDISFESSLENARKDGHICFKSKYTRRDMTVLAETCQKLAKFPSLRDYGPEFVQPAFLLCKQTNSDQNQL
jgi:hypothetical protein